MEEKYLQLANKMLSKSGFEINISNPTLSEFNTDTGDYEKTYNTFTGKAIYLQLEEGDFLNKSYSIDKIKSKLLVYTLGNLSVDSEISFNGNNYNVLSIEKIQAKLTTVVYKVLIG